MRSIKMVVQGALRPRLQPLQPSVLRLRVWPTDLNLGFHMDNVRYLKLMAMARTEFFIRSGITRATLKDKLIIPVAANTVRYLRPLLPRQSFELHTQIVGWDEKWFFIEQKITRDGKLITVALFKCVAQKQGGPKPSGFAPPAELFAKAYGRRVESPKLPRAVHAWVAALAIEKQELAA